MRRLIICSPFIAGFSIPVLWNLGFKGVLLFAAVLLVMPIAIVGYIVVSEVLSHRANERPKKHGLDVTKRMELNRKT